jgi:hypothetical protein
MKEELRNTDNEHILLVNEMGEYELVRYEEIKDAASGDKDIRAFVFERKGISYAVIWHRTGEGSLIVDTKGKRLIYEDSLGDSKTITDTDTARLTVSKRRYLHTDGLSKDELILMIKNARTEK